MKVLVTGSSGLIGSEAVMAYCKMGCDVIGVDNDMRKEFFGISGSTAWNAKKLSKEFKNYTHRNIDIRDESKIPKLFMDFKPDFTIHCAGQPSHDLAAKIPFKDFSINANGTLNLLESFRTYCPDSVFIHMSTNKVYGDKPNQLDMTESEFRYDFSDKEFFDGIPETFSIDQSVHSLFGVSKAASDLLAQEYGRNFSLKVGIFRSGCLTGPLHSSVELHGFLSYLVKCFINMKPFTIYGYSGKQVRDQIYSSDVIRAFEAFRINPRMGEVYNLGGGKKNSASVLECLNKLRSLTSRDFSPSYNDENRVGDHICYYSNLSKMKSHLNNWDVTVSLDDIIKIMVDYELDKSNKTLVSEF